jgi:hypothetical protein
VEPSNDFPRAKPGAWRRRASRAVIVAVMLSTVSSAVWTLGQIETGIWPSLRAASAVAMDEWTEGRPGPRYGPRGLERPAGYERGVPIGTSLGLGYSEGSASHAHEQFHQVSIEPGALDAFVKTGEFPEGTMIALEVADAGVRVLPARMGRFANERVGLEMAVKDHRATPDGWAYYSFGDGTRASATRFPTSACFSCHRAHAATDNVFTQFYPRLRRLE